MPLEAASQSAEPSARAFTTSNYAARFFPLATGSGKERNLWVGTRGTRATLFWQLLCGARDVPGVPHAAQQDLMPAVDHIAEGTYAANCVVIEADCEYQYEREKAA